MFTVTEEAIIETRPVPGRINMDEITMIIPKEIFIEAYEKYILKESAAEKE